MGQFLERLVVFDYEYRNITDAMEAVDVAVKDYKADHPDLSEDDLYWDACQAVQMSCSPSLADELARITGVARVMIR